MKPKPWSVVMWSPCFLMLCALRLFIEEAWTTMIWPQRTWIFPRAWQQAIFLHLWLIIMKSLWQWECLEVKNHCLACVFVRAVAETEFVTGFFVVIRLLGSVPGILFFIWWNLTKGNLPSMYYRQTFAQVSSPLYNRHSVSAAMTITALERPGIVALL